MVLVNINLKSGSMMLLMMVVMDLSMSMGILGLLSSVSRRSGIGGDRFLVSMDVFLLVIGMFVMGIFVGKLNEIEKEWWLLLFMLDDFLLMDRVINIFLLYRLNDFDMFFCLILLILVFWDFWLIFCSLMSCE